MSWARNLTPATRHSYVVEPKLHRISAQFRKSVAADIRNAPFDVGQTVSILRWRRHYVRIAFGVRTRRHRLRLHEAQRALVRRRS